MFLLLNCINWLLSPFAITVFIVVILYYIVKFYTRVFTSYPPGPIPFPIIGNFLIVLFRNPNNHMNLDLINLYKKYGPIFTLWIGPEPIIFICDLQIAKEVFNKSEFSGRPKTAWGSIFNNKQHMGIIFSDLGRAWECLRKVTHSTIIKYARSDNLAQLVNREMEQNVQLIKTNEGTVKMFSPYNYVNNMFANIIGSVVFNRKVNIEENEFKDYQYIMREGLNEVGNKLFIWEFVPISRYFMSDPLNKYRRIFNEKMNSIKAIYEQHLETYDNTNKRDFCDFLINSKLEAVANEKESSLHLTDANLTASLFDLFIAGLESTQTGFKWCILFMAYYPEYQQKLRNEINTIIGDKIPLHEDRNQLNYVMAFISEILRFRNPLPIGTPHNTMAPIKIDKYVTPENTKVIVYQQCILMDENYWNEPEQFNPNRFLDDTGKYKTVKNPAYIPFGIGRRICPGEKLAYSDLFLALVRFLQLTNDFDIILDPKYNSIEYLESDPGFLIFQSPKEFKIAFKTRNV